MDLKKWLGYGAYKKLWSIIGKRKWTHIMRDFAYQNPMLLIIGFFILGLALKPYISSGYILPFLAGMLIAHLFWGTKWKKGQGIGGYNK